MRVILATALALAACDVPRAEPQVTVTDARVTMPAVRGRPGAGYFTVRTNAQPVRITGVTSPRAERIELHEMRMDRGVMRMGPLQEAGLPANGELEFKPGGKHAMVFGLDPALKPGDRIPLTFTFDRAQAVTVQAQVQRPGGGE